MTATAAPELTVSVRPIAEINLDNEYLRRETDVTTLKKSIETVGLIHPVTVTRKNELLAGARRLQAAKELGWDEIPVHVVDRDALVQELISIDENLVRAPLTTLELETCLNRGREIYEQIHPAASKVDLSTEELSREERLEQKVKDEEDVDSFAAVTAEKTGLSKSVIKGAIKRDALASPGVKRARGEGELNATQTNEIIKLEADTQERVLPLIADKTAKETRRIVAAARAGGLDAAIEESEKVVPLPKEYSQMLSPMKRVNRSIGRILAEELRYEGPEQNRINNELMALKNNLVLYFRMMGMEDGEAESGT
ncbi:MAG: ParB N-terminal domain-containing protein [Planctomycetota bacterium]